MRRANIYQSKTPTRLSNGILTKPATYNQSLISACEDGRNRKVQTHIRQIPRHDQECAHKNKGIRFLKWNHALIHKGHPTSRIRRNDLKRAVPHRRDVLMQIRWGKRRGPPGDGHVGGDDCEGEELRREEVLQTAKEKVYEQAVEYIRAILREKNVRSR